MLNTGNTTDDELQKITFLEARTWKEDEGATLYVNGAGDRLVCIPSYSPNVSLLQRSYTRTQLIRYSI